MKYALFLLSIFTTSTISYSQGELPAKDGKVVFESVDSSITATANELYSRSKLWLADAFRDSKEVIQLDDKENGTIMGKGNFEFVQSLATYTCYFSFKINTKDNKYRIQFYDIYTEVGTMRVTQTAEKLNQKRGADKMKNNIKKGFDEMLLTYQVAMIKKPDNNF